jgi:glycosyltransferase involved in cell wall biosynthesis
MLGGEVAHELLVSRDGERPRPLDPYRLKGDPFSGASNLDICGGLGAPTILLAEGVALELGDLDSLVRVTALISAAKRAGANVILDCQDNLFSGAWRRHDDIRIASLLSTAWTALVPPYRNLLRAARCCIASTEQLRLALTQHLGADVDIRVARNACPMEFSQTDRQQDGRVRVGYAGTPTHTRDVEQQAIGALLAAAQVPNVELHFFGWHPQYGVSSGGPGIYSWHGCQYTYHGRIFGVPEYQAALGILDVAMAPLSANAFNLCKSSQKWYEHSMHCTPMVVSDIGGPYQELVDGFSGFKADGPEMFTNRVLELCLNAELRRRIGHNAKEVVLGNYTTSHLSGEWKEALR